MKALLIAAALTGLAAASAHADSSTVPYPQGYRTWQHVKSMQILPGHALYDAFGGIHHLYANRSAMEGYRTGRFRDGAVIVFDLLAVNDGDKVVTEGARKIVGVMHRNARRYAATGGWGFEGFVGESRTQRAVGSNAAQACFACHTTRKDQGYVFSEYRN
jgi:hypothetical protein